MLELCVFWVQERGQVIAKKRHTAEQIIHKLREAEVALAQREPLSKVVRKLGITEQTYYRWLKEYGGLRTTTNVDTQLSVITKLSSPFLPRKNTHKLYRFLNSAEYALYNIAWEAEETKR